MHIFLMLITGTQDKAVTGAVPTNKLYFLYLFFLTSRSSGTLSFNHLPGQEIFAL